MTNPRTLIVGAGIAGPTTAYWLAHHGFSVTVVERAGNARVGGQAIDVHGKALDVLARMGLLDRARAAATDVRGMSVVDGRGATLARTTAFTLTGSEAGSPDVELMRTDLAEMLLDAGTDPLGDALEGTVDYVFGERVANLHDTGDVVHVTFENGEAREFDLVIGADGVRSTTRRLAFAPEDQRVDRLGRYIAIGVIPNYLGHDRWETFYSAGPDRRVCYFAASGGTRVMFTKVAPALDVESLDAAGLRALLRSDFGGDGWETPRLLDEATCGGEFYFDDLRQVVMDRWSRGRVVLAGDAAHCASPASGLGTTLALIGGYLLAGELAAAGGDHVRAFAEYERRMRPLVRDCQTRARNGGNLYLGRWRSWLQLQEIRLSNIAPLRRLVSQSAAGDKGRIATAIELPVY